MNFFRSEEHFRSWEGYEEKKEGGIIALHSLMRFFSGPYFTERRQPDYYSRMSEHLFAMIASLDTLENAGSYWRMAPLEKVGLSLGKKLGMV